MNTAQLIFQKALTTVQAEGALKNIAVHHLSGDFGPLFVATRAECTRQFSSIDDLRAWIALQPACKEVFHAQ